MKRFETSNGGCVLVPENKRDWDEIYFMGMCAPPKISALPRVETAPRSQVQDRGQQKAEAEDRASRSREAESLSR